jgi:hypothetical protein
MHAEDSVADSEAGSSASDDNFADFLISEGQRKWDLAARRREELVRQVSLASVEVQFAPRTHKRADGGNLYLVGLRIRDGLVAKLGASRAYEP